MSLEIQAEDYRSFRMLQKVVGEADGSGKGRS